MTQSTIKVAVIGAGYWGEKLITEYLNLSAKMPNLQLECVADPSQERLLHVAKTFGLPPEKLRSEYIEVLHNPEVTAVHIATPNSTHYRIAAEALTEQKNVLLEKPMCLNSQDAFRLARLAETKGSVLLIGHIFRFNNAINKIREMIRDDKQDVIRYLKLKWTSFNPPPSGRDIIFDLAPHPIDILYHVLDLRPVGAFAEARSYVRGTKGLEEMAFLSLEFPSDIIATIELSWIDRGPKQRLVTVVTEGKTIESDAIEQRITVYGQNGSEELHIERNNTIESELQHFVNCIRRKDPPQNSALTGLMNLTTLEALRQSLVRNSKIVLGGA
jgi:UDP-N-acetylglucosamine 3-dehydrogenase